MDETHTDRRSVGKFTGIARAKESVISKMLNFILSTETNGKEHISDTRFLRLRSAINTI